MKKHPIALRIGKKLRQIRLDKGWSQEELAEKCGLHRTYIGSIERGEYNLTIVSLERIAKTLDTTIGSFFSERD